MKLPHAGVGALEDLRKQRHNERAFQEQGLAIAAASNTA